MTPKLYMIPASPPSRSVLMCAKALDLELDLVTVNLLEGEQLKEDFLKKNPRHTVPVLEDDDGFIVSDSHAIMAYLVSKYGKDDSLYPVHDIKKRASIDELMHFDSGTLFARGSFIMKPLIYKGIQPTQNQVDTMREAFQILEQILTNNKTDYIAGNHLSIADFSISTSITAYSFLVPYTDFPNITAYIKRIEKLPCYEVNKEGLATLKKIYLLKLQK